MKLDNKNKLMKKILIANKIFIFLQIVLLGISVLSNFIFDDTIVFITIFSHVGIFVLFNIFIENMTEYGYIIKKYENIYQDTHSLRWFKLKKLVYKTAKMNGDTITTSLVTQFFIKCAIIVFNIVIMLFLIEFE